MLACIDLTRQIIDIGRQLENPKQSGNSWNRSPTTRLVRAGDARADHVEAFSERGPGHIAVSVPIVAVRASWGGAAGIGEFFRCTRSGTPCGLSRASLDHCRAIDLQARERCQRYGSRPRIGLSFFTEIAPCMNTDRFRGGPNAR